MQKFRWSHLLLLVGVLGVARLVLFPLSDRGRGGVRSPCQTHLKQLALATKMYLQDNDERYPSLENVAGWRLALWPYAKDDAIFQCPTEGNATPDTSDYWFNARLSGIPEARLDAQALTVMFGDGYSTADPGVSLSHLPKGWIDDPKSPARRHLDGLNIAFADGHAKWLRPDKISTNPVKVGGTTFAIQ